MLKYEEVAFRASDDVPMLNTPSTLDKIQCLASVPALVSVMARYGAVPATWRFQFGVVVPIPTFPAVLMVNLSVPFVARRVREVLVMLAKAVVCPSVD